MSRRVFSLALVLGFGTLLGVIAWRTFADVRPPDYRRLVTWDARWIAHPDSPLNHAYLRKRVSIKSRPVQGWLTVMAPDEFSLYVNGVPVETVVYLSGYAQKTFDITRLLTPGVNVIAVHNTVATFPQRPRIAVQGRYVDAAGDTVDLSSDGTWRVTWRDESRLAQAGAVTPTEWYQPSYDDGHWAHAVEARTPAARITQALTHPPALVTAPLSLDWMWADPASPEAFLRQTLHLDARPQDAWLRIAAKRHYRLLVNGYPLAVQETAVASNAPADHVVRFYQIAPYLTRGANVVAVHAANERVDRGVVVDGFIVGDRGPNWLSPEWKASSAPAPGWERRHFDDSSWGRATVLRPVSPVEQASFARELAPVSPPLAFAVRRVARAAGVILAGVVAAALLWLGLAAALARLAGRGVREAQAWVAPIFVLPALLLLGAWAVSFDPRVPPSFVYQPGVVAAAVALLLLLAGALLLGALLRRPGRTSPAPVPLAGPVRAGGRWIDGSALLAVALTVLGFALRFKDMTREPLHGDEAAGVQWAQGILARGFGSIVIDGRVKPVATSELTYYPKALGIWLFGPDEFGMRIPDVVFGTLTILVLYLVGARLLGRRVGLLAAAVYTVVPSAIGMTHHGRYPSQLQLCALIAFALLVAAFLDGFRPRRYYLAVAALVGTYLSWEGTLFFVVAATLGIVVLTRPDYRWLRRGHVWVGVGLFAAVVAIQMSLRFATQAQWPTYGSGLADASPALMFRYPFYEPTFYLEKFFLIENHHVLTALFFLGAPLWGGRSRLGRVLGALAITVLGVLALMTNLLENANWRYVHYLFPLFVLGAAGAAIAFVDRLGALLPPPPVAPVARAIRLATGAAVVAGVLVFSTSLVVKLYDLPWSFGAQYTRLGARYNPTFGGAAAFLRERLRPGDVVVTMNAHLLKADLGRVDDYFESYLHQTLLAGSDLGLAMHKFTGIPALLSEPELQERLARANRIWYVSYSSTFDPALSGLLQRQARVMYEDWRSVVFLFGPPT
jgi:hypothetical protein